MSSRANFSSDRRLVRIVRHPSHLLRSKAAEPSPEERNERAKLALEIDRVMRERAPAGWKGDQAREAQVLNALFPLLNRNREATLGLFELIKNQPGY